MKACYNNYKKIDDVLLSTVQMLLGWRIHMSFIHFYVANLSMNTGHSVRDIVVAEGKKTKQLL